MYCTASVRWRLARLACTHAAMLNGVGASVALSRETLEDDADKPGTLVGPLNNATAFASIGIYVQESSAGGTLNPASSLTLTLRDSQPEHLT